MAKEKQDYNSVKAREQEYKIKLQDAGLIPKDEAPTLMDEITDIEDKARNEIAAIVRRTIKKTGREFSAPLGAVGDPTGVMVDYDSPCADFPFRDDKVDALRYSLSTGKPDLILDMSNTIQTINAATSQAEVCKAAGRFMYRQGSWNSAGQAGTWARKKIMDGYCKQIEEDDKEDCLS